VKLVADCHTKALRRSVEGAFGSTFTLLKKFSLKAAQMILVSNDSLRQEALQFNMNVLVLPDRIPSRTFEPQYNLSENLITIISGFAEDEPVGELVKLASYLPSPIELSWTGKISPSFKKRFGIDHRGINFTGYLKDAEFIDLITKSSCVVVLTTEESCLMSGAYEALAAEVPMVLSDTKALRDFFGESAIYCENSAASIACAVRRAILKSSQLRQASAELKKKRSGEFEILATAMVEIILNSHTHTKKIVRRSMRQNP
jgi:glycosyltransferase involved in cell wall biosynthesis